MLKFIIMTIISKLIEIEAKMPIDNNFIEARLHEMNIYPLRWAIVKINGDKLTISLSCENL